MVRTCPRCGNRYPDRFEECPVDGAPLEAEAPVDPLTGTVLLGTYRVEEAIRRGGMARIYRAVNDRVGRAFAVKVLGKSLAADSVAVARFIQEARAAAALHHPGIVQVLDCATTEEGVPFIVMELLDGEDADALVSRVGRLPLEQALRIAEQTASALAAAHERGIVHRDIKPANLFLLGGPVATQTVKVLDFGIARLLGGDRLTTDGGQWGTPEYMAPEQARGDIELDARADVYSLGATLYHLLAGHPPFRGESPMAIIIQHLTDPPPSLRLFRNDVPRGLDRLVARMLAKDPSDRPGGAAEVGRQLAALLPSGAPATVELDGTPTAPAPGSDEVRVVTVLVADLEPDEELDLEAQEEEVAASYVVLSNAVAREGGLLARMVGGRAVGVFGLQLSFGDEPVRAVRASAAARRQLPKHTSMRVAVGTGRTLAASGAVSTGPAARAVSALVGQVPRDAVVVDGATFARIRAVFPARPAEGDGLAGAYLIDATEERTTPRGSVAATSVETPLVGRDDELARLWEAFEWTARERQPSAVLLVGEAGLGKSRLKTEWVYRLDETAGGEVWYLEGQGRPLAADQPFSALADLLRRQTGQTVDASPVAVRQRVSELCESVGVTDSAAIDLLASLARGGDLPSGRQSAFVDAPQQRRERALAAFTRLFAAMAGKRPLVLCIEDAQHVDRASVEALGKVYRACEGLPLLVLAVGRPEALDRFTGSELLEDAPLRLDLEPLSRSETRRLLAELLGAEPSRSLHDAVLARSEGVPLFVEEVFFALRQQGALAPDGSGGGSLRLVDTAELACVPSTVHGVLQSRLDALAPELRLALRQASVLGRVFWDEALAALGGKEVAEVLSALARRQLVTVSPHSSLAGCREYELRSAALRDVAYESVPARERAALHSVAADWLSAHGAAPSVLAHHLERAGRIEEAVRELLRAGASANRTYANEEALAHYRAAVELADQAEGRPGSPTDDLVLEALRGQEVVLTRLGRQVEALAALDAIDRLAEAGGDRAALARAAVSRGALVRLRDPRQAVALLESALASCREVGDAELECVALRQLAQAAAFSGDLDRGAEAIAAAVAAARALDTPDAPAILVVSLIVQGTIDTIRGGALRGLPPLEEALEIARTTGNVEREADVLMRCGYLRAELGDLPRAEADLRSARELCLRTGNQRDLAFTEHNLGWVLWTEGRADEAIAAEEAALAIARAARLAQVELESEVYLALVELGQGRAAAALERAAAARGAAGSAGHAEPELHAAMVETLALGALGRGPEAAEAGRATAALFTALGSTQQFEVELHLVAARALLAEGHADEAGALLASARAALERRLAPVTDPAARDRLLRHVGAGLPREIVKMVREIAEAQAPDLSPRRR